MGKRAAVYCVDCDLLTQRDHDKGVFHKNSARIRVLLREPCVNFSEIARRLTASGHPVTRERIRQIAKKIEGLTGNERGTVCMVRRRAAAQTDFMKRLEPICVEWGLKLESVIGTDRWPLKRTVRINGVLCEERSMCMRGVGTTRLYANIHRPVNSKAEFLLCWLPARELWFILPRKAWPRTQALFALDPTPGRPGTKSSRHDWLDYKEAWHLLRENA
jgi:hypothetical protein